MAKYISKYSGERIDHSVGVIPAGDPSEASVIVYSGVDEDENPISTYKKVSEMRVTVVQETGDSETQVMSQKAVTNALATKVDKQSVVQEPGEATDKVMSQKAVTDSLNDKINYTDINNGLTVADGKIKANIAKIQDSTSNEFTPDENGVVTIPNGSRTNFGLLKSNYVDGIQSPNGILAIWPASKEDINKRTNSFSGTLYPDGPMRPIVYNAINYVVKSALTGDKRIGTETTTTDSTTFTDTEKDRACEILGASRKLYRHYTTFNSIGHGSCKLSFISLKSDVYSSEQNLSELKDVVSVEYCTIGESSYLIGTFFINPNDGDYTLRAGEYAIVIPTDIASGSFTDTVTEL